MAIWGFGFLLVSILGDFHGMGNSTSQIYQLAIFGVFAIASIIYKPTSSAWISELAPANLRGAYTAIAYQCWAIGYVIGPIIGGWLIDQSHAVAQYTWIAVALSTLSGLVVLQVLSKRNATLQENIVIDS